MYESWWQTETVVEEAIAAARWATVPPRQAGPLPAAVVLIMCQTWARKYPEVALDLENRKHQARLIVLVRQFATMPQSELRRLANRTSPEYVASLHEYYKRRERYSDATMIAERCRYQIFPNVHALLVRYMATRRTGNGTQCTVTLEEDAHARQWMAWVSNICEAHTVNEALRRL